MIAVANLIGQELNVVNIGLASFGEQTGLLWSTAAFTIILSVLVHGLSSGWAMQWVERGRA